MIKKLLCNNPAPYRLNRNNHSKTPILRSNKSFEVQKRIVLINPQEFMTEYNHYRSRKNNDYSVNSDMGKSSQTIQHFHLNKTLKKYESKYFAGAQNLRIEREMLTDDLINRYKNNIKNRICQTTETQSRSNIIFPYLHYIVIDTFTFRKEKLTSEISKYEKEKSELITKRMNTIEVKRNVDMLMNDIKKYKNITDNCKRTFMELSFQINTLKKELEKVKGKNND